MNINKEILRLSVPAIVSNVTVPLLGLCDTGISGHLGSEIYLAAIAVGSMMMNVVVWLFGFLRMGTSGITANAFGRGDDFEVRRSLTASLIIALLLGLLLILFRDTILRLLLLAIHPEDDVENLVCGYFGICVAAAPAILATMSVSGWFVGMQSTVWPMVIAISVNIVNMIVSFTLVFHFDMGFRGVAAGTFCANWFGFLMSVAAVFIFRRGRKVFVGIRSLLDAKLLSRLFTVNSNLFFRSACIISVSLGVTAAGARMGSLTLAVNAILMQFFTMFSFFMDGFAFSAEALVGRWAGASNRLMLDKSVKALLKWSGGVAAVFSLAYIFGTPLLASILTDDRAVRLGVHSMRVVVWLIPVVSVWAFIYDGFFVGITVTGKMLLATFSATLVFFICAFVVPDMGGTSGLDTGNVWLWTAFLAYLLLRGVILAALWPSQLRRKLEPEHHVFVKTENN